MPRPTYGPKVKERAETLLRTLLLHATGEIEGSESLGVKCKWEPKSSTASELVVETTLRALAALCAKALNGKSLTKAQIREALNRMEDFLGILKDHRVNNKGSEDWHFTLTLWSPHIHENVKQFGQTWEANRSPKSKQYGSTPPSFDEECPDSAVPDSTEKEANLQQIGKFNLVIDEATHTDQIGDRYITINHLVDPVRPSRAYKPLQMPPLPDYFVERPEHQQTVKALLLTTDNAAPGTLVVSAIYGLGGIGKSVLAAALAHDPDVQARFADGILWATLGQEPDILSFLSSWIQALGDRDYKPTSIDAASVHLRSLLYDKQVLLVVDDAWNPDHVEPFRIGGKGCRVLVTTRETDVIGAKRYDLEEMTPEQSLTLLTQKYPDCVTEHDHQQAVALAQAVGNLPLALELAAAQLTDGVTFDELLEDLQAEVSRLETLDRPGAELSQKQRKNLSLLASLNLSLQQLSPEQQKQFAWIGILPEDVLITEAVAATLWELTPRQASTTLRFLRSRALLLAGAQQPGQKLTYRLHDLMHDLAKRLLTSEATPQSQTEILGLGLPISAAHSIFLDRYRVKAQHNLWHTLSDDGYIHTHLTWHLEQAECLEEIHQLLQEETSAGRNGWYEACEALGQTASFITDVARAWQLAEKLYDNSPATSIGLQCRYVFITASLNSLASNLPPELIAALVEKGYWQPVQGIAYIQQIQEARQRAAAVIMICSYLPESLLPEALEVTRQIQDEFFRAVALSALALYLPESLLPEVLELTRQIKDDSGCAYVLSALVPHLPKSLLPEALEVTRQIQNESDRIDALSALVLHLPESLLPEALEVIRQIQDESLCADALSALVLYLPGSLLPEALEVTRQIQDESDRIDALSALVPHLPESLLSEALEVARQIQPAFLHAHALSVLVPRLPKLVTEALELTWQIQYESVRANVLSALVPYLPESLLPEAIEAIRQIQDKFFRADALKALIPHLPESLLPEVLEVTRQIQDEFFRADALKTLAPHLPKSLLPEALEVARQIQDEFFRADALSALVPHLPESLLPEALEVIRQIQDEFFRADALSALVLYLPGSLLPEALEVTRQIQSASDRAKVLSALVPHLPESLLPEALEATQQIQSASDRAHALRALLPRLPKLAMEALEVTRRIQDESGRAHALSALVPYLPKLAMEALEVTWQIKDAPDRARAFKALVPHLSESLLPKALEVTRRIQDESGRAHALSALVPYLPKLATEALEVTWQIKDEFDRAHALRALVPHLPESLLPEALKAFRQIKSRFFRAHALSALVPRLPKLVTETLEATRQIQDESLRAKVLSALAPYLPEALLPEALEATRQIQSESIRVDALSALVPYLPELVTEALEATRQIQYELTRAHALSALVPYCPELVTEALEVTRQIQDEFLRAHALKSLVPHLPKSLLPEVLEVTQQIKNETGRAKVLSALVPHHSELVTEALEVTWQIQSEFFCIDTLSALAPHLPESLLLESLKVTRQIQSESGRAKALKAIAPYLPKSLLPEALEITRRIRDKYHSAQAFQGMADRLIELSTSTSLWHEVLHILSHLRRNELLPTMAELRPFIVNLGGEEALEEMIRAMREVCHQWR